MNPVPTPINFASCFFASLSFALPAGAESFQEKLAGTWVLESVVNEIDGKKVEPFGPNPSGYFIFTVDGHYSFQIVRPGRVKFASNNRVKGTPEEYKQAYEGIVSIFGTYKIANEQDGTINLHVVGSSFPNWDGTDQVRKVSISGEEMLYTNPTGAIGGVAVQKLKKAK